MPLSPNSTLNSWSDLNPLKICFAFTTFLLSFIAYSELTSKTSAHIYSITADKAITAFNEIL